MNAVALPHPPAAVTHRSLHADAVLMLQAFAVAVMVFPSDSVLKPVGAEGYPAALLGMFIFGIFTISVLLGFHDPFRARHPIQGVLCVIWLAVLLSYIFMDRGRLTSLQLAAADRALIRFAVVTGIALVAAEWLRSLEDAMRVVRALCWGAAVCGLVAVLQYWASFDVSQYLRQLPGFTVRHDNPAILARGSLNRVAGTSIIPIELGVVAGMMIPLAVCLGLYDRQKTRFKRWAPLTLIILGVATSVSRSAILAVFVSFVVMVVLLPPVPRMAALCVLPVALAGIFVSAHGLIGTLVSFFTGASTDPSVQYRTHDYPLAEQLWQSAPLFGHGPATWMPVSSLDIFDNQYLAAVVELGLVGVLALLFFFVVPGIVALGARRESSSQDFRLLCASLAASAFVAPICSFTFDSWSFPMFVNVYALVIGLIGACARLAAGEPKLTPSAAFGPLQFAVPPPAATRPERADT